MENITFCYETEYSDKNYEIIKGEEKRKDLISMDKAKEYLKNKLTGFFLIQDEITVLKRNGESFVLKRNDLNNFIENTNEYKLITYTFLHDYKDSTLTYKVKIYFE